jgi:hypothetical protein
MTANNLYYMTGETIPTEVVAVNPRVIDTPPRLGVGILKERERESLDQEGTKLATNLSFESAQGVGIRLLLLSNR